ncbi:hypothetical protein [Bacillus sp. LL01]|uniref:hypothetical protein n=1 Tax=Bacillus sp. LL01 TaxID=1665556 RepID=UPI00069E02C2|nr:hypothetical protein [Bacillus sp. LL01]
MRIEIAEHARMSERGSSLLRLIQNNDMPTLDLLIRESVQNSLDAARKDRDFVKMDFQVKEFVKDSMIPHFDGVGDNLNRQFPEETQKCIVIKDSNTTGLTGPIHYTELTDNHFGNLLKLIYEISMPQQQEGAGGSWGLGKTIYFRIGIGLVIYYTRTTDANGKLVSRLAACLVEDEEKVNTVIPKMQGKPQRGIAWWGQDAGNNSTKPVTDEDEIHTILKVFNTEPYQEDETGTTVIIPFINEELLLSTTTIMNYNDDHEETREKPWWTSNIHDYLGVALQRWYAPRIGNKHYKNGKWLKATVDEKAIHYDSMLPLFKVVQSLYNRIVLNDKIEEKDILTGIPCHFKDINLKRVFTKGGCAGYLAYVKLTSVQLLMTPPYNNPNPFIQINENDITSDLNSPIVMYIRKPGMIVGYETTGNWTEGIPKTKTNEFIVGLFVTNSDNELEINEKKITLEEYIRKSEKADHTSWYDWNIGVNRLNIVSKIQRQVRKSISDEYSEKQTETYSRRNIGLGRVLADILLPPENFGNKAGGGQGGSGADGGAGGGNSRSLSLKISGSPSYINNMMKVDFELRCGKKAKKIHLELQVVSESGGISSEKWENPDVIGKPFPIRLEKLEVTSIKHGRTSLLKTDTLELNDKNRSVLFSEFEFGTLNSNIYNIPFGIGILVPKAEGHVISGSAYFSVKDDSVQGNLIVDEVEGVSV